MVLQSSFPGNGLPVLQNGNFTPIKSSYCSLKAVLKTSCTLSVLVSDELPALSKEEVFAACAGVPRWLPQVARASKALACSTAPGMPGVGLPASRCEKQGCCSCSSSGSPAGIPYNRSLAVAIGLCRATLSAPRSPWQTVPGVLLGTRLQANGEGQPAHSAPPRAAEGLMSPAHSPRAWLTRGNRGFFTGCRKARAAWEAAREGGAPGGNEAKVLEWPWELVGGHTSAPSTEGWKEVISYLDFFPFGCFEQFYPCFKKGSGRGRNGFVLEEFPATWAAWISQEQGRWGRGGWYLSRNSM